MDVLVLPFCLLPLAENLSDRQAAARTICWSMTVRCPPIRHKILQTARLRQQTEAFKVLYRVRVGIEGTFSQTTRNTGLRRARSIG